MSGCQEVQTSENARGVRVTTGTESQKGDVPYGYCLCGCGTRTKISKTTDITHGYVKGQPRRFAYGHFLRFYKRNGGVTYSNGRKMVMTPGHHRANRYGFVYNSILVAEDATGIEINQPAEVHHVNCDVSDDSNKNLVICQDRAYHFFIEIRSKAFLECGNARWRKCVFCGEYDDLKNLTVGECANSFSGRPYHRSCCAKYSSERYHKNKDSINAGRREAARLKRLEALEI